jgi:hypothetical protein
LRCWPGASCRTKSPGLAAELATFDLRGFTINLLAPRGDGPVRRALERDGEGPFEVTVEVADPEAAVEALAHAGIEAEGRREGPLRVPSGAAFGGRLVFAGPS